MVELDNDFKKLVTEVRKIRKASPKCFSAQDDVNIPTLLQNIIQEEVYKNDYKEITEKILEERIPYDVAIDALKQIAEKW